jgi:hypothetical protein
MLTRWRCTTRQRRTRWTRKERHAYATNTMLAGPPGGPFGHKGQVICLPSNPFRFLLNNSDPAASCKCLAEVRPITRLYAPGAGLAPHGRRIFLSNYSVRRIVSTHVHGHQGCVVEAAFLVCAPRILFNSHDKFYLGPLQGSSLSRSLSRSLNRARPPLAPPPGRYAPRIRSTPRLPYPNSGPLSTHSSPPR